MKGERKCTVTVAKRQWNMTVFCVTNNCGNANLLGVKLVRREVDHKQGSKAVCSNTGGSYTNPEHSDY